MPKPATAATAPASKSETVHEYVLFRSEGDERFPLMSSPDLDFVMHTRFQKMADALAHGQAQPDLIIIDRKCVYPLANGKRQSDGSTCEESEV